MLQKWVQNNLLSFSTLGGLAIGGGLFVVAMFVPSDLWRGAFVLAAAVAVGAGLVMRKKR